MYILNKFYKNKNIMFMTIYGFIIFDMQREKGPSIPPVTKNISFGLRATEVKGVCEKLASHIIKHCFSLITMY